MISRHGRRGDLERRIAKHRLEGRVILAGFRRDVGRFVPHFDVGVLPSFTEGLPVTLLVMAAGHRDRRQPVGNLEYLFDGGNGLLVEPGRPRELADRIGRLVDDATLRRRLGDAIREKVRSQYSFAGQSLRYQALFDALVRVPATTPVEASAGRLLLFLGFVAVVGGTYVGYPLLVGNWARLFGRPVKAAMSLTSGGVYPHRK